MSDGIPPQFVFAADQSYARAQERLRDLVSQLAGDMKERTDQSDSMPWAVSVLMMMRSQETVGISPPLIEVWQAAMYELARRQLREQKS